MVESSQAREEDPGMYRLSPAFHQPVLVEEAGEQSSSVAVQIVDVVFTEVTLKKSVSYKVRVSGSQVNSNEGTTEVLRQYHDFANVRKALADMWPGVFIPPVPPKKLIVPLTQGNTQADLVEDRRLVLEEFLKKTADSPELLTSEPFQAFLNSEERYTPPAVAPKFTSEMVARFQSAFGQFDRDCPADASESISASLSFLMQSLATMKSIRAVAKTTSIHYSQLITASSDTGEAALRFERECVSEYRRDSERKVFRYPDKDMRCNPIALVSDWMKIEALDLSAMLEAVQSYAEVEAYRRKTEAKLTSDSATLQKLHEGKSSISQIFSRKGKSDFKSEAEQRTSQVIHLQSEKDLAEAISLSRIICNLLLEHELPKFKAEKTKQYTVLLKAFAAAMRLEGEQVRHTQNLQALRGILAA